MKQYKVLCLTDHRGHSNENSIYAILRKMIEHPQCSQVDIASRGFIQNDTFFGGKGFEKIYSTKVNSDFEFSEEGNSFKRNLTEVSSLDFDLIFLRIPRPVDDDFLKSLAQFFESKVMVNNPLGIIECSNKSYLLNFPNQCPPMRLCKGVEDIVEFSKEFDLVLKPLKEYGGRGLLKIEKNKLYEGNVEHDVLTYLSSIKNQIETEGYLAMKFLKNVSKGDKRLLVVGGEILGASLRLPPEGSWLCNVAQGGKSMKSEPTPKEINIIKEISKDLLSKGILISGIDTLVDDNGERVLSEINALSIGGFPQAEKQSGKPILQLLIDKVFMYANGQ